MKKTLLALALLAAAPAVAAADKDSPIAVDVEIEGVVVTLSIGARGCSSAETTDAAVHHELKVCRTDGDDLDFEVQRVKEVKRGRTTQRIRVTARLDAGKRLVIA